MRAQRSSLSPRLQFEWSNWRLERERRGLGSPDRSAAANQCEVRCGSKADKPCAPEARPLHPAQRTKVEPRLNVCVGPEAELRQVTLAASINHERKPLVLSKLDDFEIWPLVLSGPRLGLNVTAFG
jgi:hypothetical protein